MIQRVVTGRRGARRPAPAAVSTKDVSTRPAFLSDQFPTLLFPNGLTRSYQLVNNGIHPGPYGLPADPTDLNAWQLPCLLLMVDRSLALADDQQKPALLALHSWALCLYDMANTIARAKEFLDDELAGY